MADVRIKVECAGLVAEGSLFSEQAPNTVAALLDRLPISDRTIQTRWSGNAWRTEGNYELQPREALVENVAGRLQAGDIIYYPEYDLGLVKIGIAYGPAQWFAPFAVPLKVALIGRLDSSLEQLASRWERIVFEGPMPVHISRA